MIIENREGNGFAHARALHGSDDATRITAVDAEVAFDDGSGGGGWGEKQKESKPCPC
jgi:hypothetical protein